MRPVHLLVILFFLIVDVIIADETATHQKWGTVTGRVLIDGELPVTVLEDESLVIDAASKGIANVVVYVRSRPDAVDPDFDDVGKSEEIQFEIKDGRFEPHLCLVRTTVTLRLVSHDSTTHAVQTFPNSGSPLTRIIPPNQTDGFQLPPQLKPERIPVKVIDPTDASMSAYWVVLDHPYAAVTDKEGKFEIPQLPIGEHSFVIWHERSGYLKKGYKIDVKPGMNELARISIAGAALQKDLSKLQQRTNVPVQQVPFLESAFSAIVIALTLIFAFWFLTRVRKSTPKKADESLVADKT